MTMEKVITLAIEDYVSKRMRDNETRTRWDSPLIGFASADDPLFAKLKEAVRPSHATPVELLPGARTVIVYFLPFSREIARSNRLEHNASREWAVAYVETNQLIIDLNHHLAELLKDHGYASKVLPPTHNFDTEQLMADWSHKHIAYIAGLGKFGLHHMLITKKGCCGRFGSLVTNAAIKTTPRSEGEFCLSMHDGSCKVCIKKCPVDALAEEFYDRHKCYELLLENADIYASEGLADVCGKCTSVVPCSFINPVAAKEKKE